MYEHTKSICHVLAYINIPEVSPSIKELWPLFHCVTPTRTTLHCIGFGLGSDREAPRHEESLIMSHISGGIESTHPKTHIQQHTYTKGKQDGCFQWLRFNWKLRFILDPRWCARQQLRGVQDRKHFITLCHTPRPITSNTSLSQKWLAY